MEEIRKVHNDPGAANPGVWVYKVLMFVILVAVVGALMPTLNTQLTRYAANETTFGPILKTVAPLLVGAAILIVGVAMFLPEIRTIRGGLRG